MFFYYCFACLSVGYSFRLNGFNSKIHHHTSVNDAVLQHSRTKEHSRSYMALHSAVITKNNDIAGVFDEPTAWTTSGYRKPLHWVQKVSHLEDTLQFYQSNFNFKVYRHEEFSTGCEATCNGPYGGAWSKTMLGPEGGEANNFCLELVFNYGVNRYERGNDLRSIGLSRAAFVGNPSLIGTDSSGKQFLQTPDGHWLNLVLEAGDSEFITDLQIPTKVQNDSIKRISLHVSNLSSSIIFYENILGARVEMNLERSSACCYWDNTGTCLSNGSKEEVASVSVHHLESTTPVRVSQTCIELTQIAEGLTLEFQASQGRMAIETEDGAIEKIAERVLTNNINLGESNIIVHGPVKLEPHGERVIILKDEDGHEYCFVDARGFKNCVDVSKKQSTVDWNFRSNMHKKASADYIGGKGFDPAVTVVDAGNYDEIVANSDKDVLFDLYAPWCILCARNKPVYEELAKRISEIIGGDIIFSVFDGSKTPMSMIENDQLGMMMDWAKTQGFPALFYLRKGEKSSPIEFNGPWTIKGLSEWVASLSSSPLDLSKMNMEELPEFVFDDEKDVTKNEDQIAQNNDDSPKKKYRLTLDDDDDCNNCSL